MLAYFDHGQASGKALLEVLQGKVPWRRPIWLMRQAGRYLPEYRELRSNAGSFLDLCFSPELAAEATLQPLRRFDLDAAILFADILLLPQMLGCDLTFKENEGPRLSPVRCRKDLIKLSATGAVEKLQPVYDTVAKVSSQLPQHVGFIGFCGAPWTVATYMIEGGTSVDRERARLAAYAGSRWFDELIELLVDTSTDYLCAQISAGVDVVQIFDTWAGDLPDGLREKYCFGPIDRISKGVKQQFKDVPVIGFARGIGVAQLDFAKQCQLDAVGIDLSVPLLWAANELQGKTVVQGNLDPLCLVAGGDALADGVRQITGTVRYDRHIMNLGHGIRPETPPENVGLLVDLVRQADEVRVR